MSEFVKLTPLTPLPETRTDPDGTVKDVKTGKILKGVAQDTNKNDTAGRPTDYRPEYCEEIVKMFEREPFEERVINKRFGANEFEEIQLIPAVFPTLQEFAWSKGVTPQVIADWCEKFPEFKRAVTRAKAQQERLLFINSLNKSYDSRFATFLLTNNHGMSNTVKTEGTTEIKISYKE